jgi:hypothetical protein
LLPAATADLADFIETDTETGKQRFKNLDTLPPEKTAAVAQARIGPDGRISSLKLHSKIDAVNSILKNSGLAAPDRLLTINATADPVPVDQVTENRAVMQWLYQQARVTGRIEAAPTDPHKAIGELRAAWQACYDRGDHQGAREIADAVRGLAESIGSLQAALPAPADPEGAS